ncbi:MAG: hypothetical protein KGL39_47765 [Patescibacteria group bacterium]|nr:hypothetical protein [Patescibacteria group bacterium]
MKTLSSEICENCPVRKSDTWRRRATLIRRELRRKKISDNERRILEVLTDLTLGWERNTIAIPDHYCFEMLTGIKANHIGELLAALHRDKFIRISTVRGVATYSIREDPDPDGLNSFIWNVRSRTSLEAMAAALERIREHNDLPQLPRTESLETIANFKAGNAARNFAPAPPKFGSPHGVATGLTRRGK